MVALTQDRNTPRFDGELRQGPVAAAVQIFAGSLVMRDAAGRITKGATALNAVGVGRAETAVDNRLGAAGAVNVTYRPGIYQFANSAAADAITIADIGRRCFIVDDQTVARTDGGATRSPAGLVEDVTPQGVRVRFDEALTRAA